MSIFSSIGNFAKGIFGDDEDEKKKKKKQQQQQPTVVRPTSFKPQLTPNQTKPRGTEVLQVINAANPGLKLQKITPPDDAAKKQADLERRTQQNMAGAKKEASKGESWIGRNVLNRGAIKGRSEVIARSRAATQYQDDNGWKDADDVLTKFNKGTKQISDSNSERSASAERRLNTAAKRAEKVGKIAQYVPITGSVTNLGLAGAERLEKARGNKGSAKDIANTRAELDFDMSSEELEKLDPETRAKLQNIRNISLGAAPLDVLGFAGLSKAAVGKSATKAAKEFAKKGAVTAGTKKALKEGAKQSAKSMVAPAAVGTGLSAGAQQYLAGDIDEAEAAKSGLIVAGISQLFPGKELKKTASRAAKNATKDAKQTAVKPTKTTTPSKTSVDPAMTKVRKSNNAAIAAFDEAMAENIRLADDGDNAMPIVRPAKQAKSSAAATPNVAPLTKAATPRNPRMTTRRPVDPSMLAKVEDQIGTPEGATIRATNSARARSPVTATTRELEEGVESANPNQAQDAAAQIAAETPVPVRPDDNTPAFERRGQQADEAAAAAAARDQAAIDAGAGDTPLDRPTFLFKQELDDVARQADDEFTDFVNNNQGVSRQELEAAQESIRSQALERIAALQAQREGSTIEADLPPAPEPVAAAISPDPTPLAASTIPEAQAAPITETPPAPAPDIAPPAGEAPPLPALPSGVEADVAPRTHDALVSALGPSPDRVKGQYGRREQINLDELKTRADNAIADMDDASVLQSFQTTGTDTMVTDANSFALARSALSRLSKMDDPVASQTVTNIMDAMERYASKSGQALRIIQEEFDALPIPMKVRYIVKKIDAANADDPNYIPLRDRPDVAARIEDEITLKLEAAEKIAARASAIEGRLESIADAATRGERAAENPRALVKELNAERRALAESNGELAKYYEGLTPKRKRGQRANDFAKRMMLFNLSGRLNDIVTTSANVANLGVQNTIQGVLAKAVNTVKPGTITDTSRGGRAFWRGTGEGLKKSKGEFQGKRYAGDLQKALRGDESETRNNMRRSTGFVGQKIQAATEAATQVSSGVRDQRLYQLAVKEGQQQGLKGSMLTQYADARSAVPNRMMKEAAEQLHMEMNNLNQNPVSTALNRIGSAIEGKSALGGLIKNQVMPFTSWLGGNIYNSVTDKNVVANAIKIADAARKGNADLVVQNVSKLANNAAQTYALGYLLTQQGIITNEDAEGYNDAGAYFHIGDRYIPVGFLGFVAPNVVLGNAVFNGLNDPEAGSPGSKIGAIAEDALGNMARSINLTGAVGAETNLGRAVNTGLREGGNMSEGALEFLSGAVGQFIPGLAGDVNSVLNNYTDLNPTKEAPLTKATKEDGTKDYLQTAKNRIQSRIPGLSQQLPRKADVAAPDPLDRLTRGNRDTEAGAKAREDKKAEEKKTEDMEKVFKDKGYKLTKDNLEAPFQDSDFDTYTKGLKYYMDKEKSEGTLTKKDEQGYERDLARAKVLKDNKYSFEDYEAYNKMGLEDWRKLGDPDEDTYNPELFQALWEMDERLTKVAASDKEGKPETQKYSPKKKKSSSGGGGSGSGESDALKLVKSNTLGNRPDLGRISFGDLRPEKANSAPIPTIQKLKAEDLVKKRKISVSKA